MKKFVTWLLAAALVLGVLSGCQGDPAEPDDSAPDPVNTGGDAEIVNIGSTDPISSMNPLLLDATEISRYALGMSYMPLTELNADLEFVPMLADKVTTEDNITYTVHIDDRAKWSDGTPVSSDDLIFTLLRMGARSIANPSNGFLNTIKGFGDDGFVDDDATEAEGLTRVDDKTVAIEMKSSVPLTIFQNTYARYIYVIPKHKLEDVPAADLPGHAYFEKPDTVSGPYRLTELDGQHYASYVANENFWLGAPEIERLNIQVVQGSSLVSSLTSGEIHFTQQTFGQIPQVDQETVADIEHVRSVYEEPLTNQFVFINNEVVPDRNVRLAMAMAIDRNAIVETFYNGYGEVVEGFLTSYSPFFDEDLEPWPYDPEEAKRLVDESGWDTSRVLQFNINSGDTTFQQVANIIVEQLDAIGIQAQIRMMDLNTLLSHAGNHDFDMMAVQYTFAPVDPYPDMDWLAGVGGNNWVQYDSEAMQSLLASVMASTSDDELQAAYTEINELMKEDMPFFNCYVIRSMGAVSKRLKGAEPRSYGSFINVHEWKFED